MKDRMVVRTIRNGRVKIGGKWYAPFDKWMKYDGRLDGMRYAFARYWHGKGGEVEPFISLWGTEAYYKGLADDDQEINSPSHIVQGDGGVIFEWVWWDEVEA